MLLYVGRTSEAVTELRKALDLDPTNLLARFELGKALTFLGRYSEAAKQFPDAIDAETGNDIATVAWSYGMAGNRTQARSILSRLQARSTQRYTSEVALAVAAIGAGDNSLALDYLEKAVPAHSFFLIFLPNDGRFDAIRADPRFQRVVRDVQKNY
jgi:tetratricopeptide (TPR) repeat protein